MSALTWVFYILLFINFIIAFFYLLTFLEAKKFENKKIKRYPKISFVIPAYNEEESIAQTINSILSADYPKNKLKIFIVNDGSTDRTAEIVSKIAKRKKCVTLLNKKNEGSKAKAVNFGIRKVKTELIAVLDADTIIQEDILKKALPRLQRKEIMAVTCKSLPLNKGGFLIKMQGIEYIFVSFYRKLLGEIGAMSTAPAFAIFKTEFFKKYGGFDENNISEDFEIGLRIHSRRYFVNYMTDSYVETIVPSTFKTLRRQRVRWGYGTVYNLAKYKGLFGRKYGNLGFFSLPTVVFGILSLLLFFCLGTYTILYSLIKYIQLIPIYGFNINVNLWNLILMLSDTHVILSITGILFALFFFFLIKKESKEKINFFDYLIYIFVYVWILAYFYVLTIISLFKKPSW